MLATVGFLCLSHPIRSDPILIFTLYAVYSETVSEQQTAIWDREHVKLASLALADDACSVRSIVVVQNLAFSKHIAACLTIDQ